MRKLFRIITNQWVTLAICAALLITHHFLHEQTVALREDTAAMCADIGTWYGVTRPGIYEPKKFFHWSHRADFVLRGELKAQP